jgi:glutamate-ammonia-ligase adenylyltransferase
MNSSAPGNAERQKLAARFVGGPHVSASSNAEQVLEDWLSELEPEQSAALDELLEHPFAKTILLGIAEFSPYLFDLVRTDAARLIRVLACDPESHLSSLIEKTTRDVFAAAGETDVMHLLRRMKAEAALLIALCDIGGVWPVMRVTAALTDLAVASVQAGLRFLLRQEVTRGRMNAVNHDHPEEGSGLIVLAMGKMGAGVNYSSDIDLIVFLPRRNLACVRHRTGAVFRARYASARAAIAPAQRRRLCVPRRSAAAAGSRLDACRDLDRGGAALL